MTLDEAIKRSEEVMVENIEKTKGRNASDPIAINCFECAGEHRQLAEWLKDYKRMLEQEPCDDATLKDIFCMGCEYKEQESKTGHCEDCKHFRKLPHHAGILGKCICHTGFCPKGDWYCADYEPQEER